ERRQIALRHSIKCLTESLKPRVGCDRCDSVPGSAREGARAPRKRGVAGWSPQHKALRASCREYWTASSFHNFGDDEKIIGLSRCIAQRLGGSEPIVRVVFAKDIENWNSMRRRFYSLDVHFI